MILYERLKEVEKTPHYEAFLAAGVISIMLDSKMRTYAQFLAEIEAHKHITKCKKRRAIAIQQVAKQQKITTLAVWRAVKLMENK